MFKLPGRSQIELVEPSLQHLFGGAGFIFQHPKKFNTQDESSKSWGHKYLLEFLLGLCFRWAIVTTNTMSKHWRQARLLL